MTLFKNTGRYSYEVAWELP